MKIPDWYVLILLALASYRTWRLLAEDEILDPLRNRLLRLDPRWEKEGDPTGDGYREGLGKFLSCPWCFGFWITLAWWGAWQVDDFWTTVFAVPMAISALVPLIERATSQS